MCLCPPLFLPLTQASIFLFFLFPLNTIYCKMHNSNGIQRFSPRTPLITSHRLLLTCFSLTLYTLSCYFTVLQTQAWRMELPAFSLCLSYLLFSHANRIKQAESLLGWKNNWIQHTNCLNKKKPLVPPPLLTFFHCILERWRSDVSCM